MTDEISITALTPLSRIEKLDVSCERCNHCCTFDSGIFLDEDIKRIADFMGMHPDEFTAEHLDEKLIYGKKVHKAKLKKKDKPFGACSFHDKSMGCSIQEVKPLHCRIGSGCKPIGRQINTWFMLNYVLDRTNPYALKEWEAFCKVHETIPGGHMEDLGGRKNG
jgi:hypothetical protein